MTDYIKELDATASMLNLGESFIDLRAADRERVLNIKTAMDQATELRRIADALWGNSGPIDGATAGIVQLLNGIEANIARRA